MGKEAPARTNPYRGKTIKEIFAMLLTDPEIMDSVRKAIQ